MELVEFKVWGVTSLQAAEHETKPSSASFVFLKKLVYPSSLSRTFYQPTLPQEFLNCVSFSQLAHCNCTCLWGAMPCFHTCIHTVKS